MSDTKKRKPMISGSMLRQIVNDPRSHDKTTVGCDVRDFYEDLITTGKLRVVEEVEVKTQCVTKRMDQFSGASYYDCELRCCGCSVFFQVKTVNEQANFCPGCGNKIKQ